MTPRPFTGILSSDSPALSGALRRRGLRGEELEAFNRRWQQIVQSGCISELHGYEREEGVSFNPRPARAAMLLLEEDRAVTLEEMILLLDRCCDAEEWIADSRLPRAVALALALDEARHLHLVLDAAIVAQRTSVLRGIASAIPHAEQHSSLRKKLEAALARFP